jgi:hypothetical protein
MEAFFWAYAGMIGGVFLGMLLSSLFRANDPPRDRTEWPPARHPIDQYYDTLDSRAGLG